MNIKEIMSEGIDILKEENIQEAKLKTRIVLSHILKEKKEYLMTHDEEIISEDNVNKFLKCIEKLKKGLPVQYITNKKEFMKLDFYVDENVLIPQDDTEILVQKALEKIEEIEKKHNNIKGDFKNEQIKVLDLCTGSGAIGISIAKYSNINNIQIYCSDISEEALKIAKYNSIANNVDKNINIIQSDLFKNISGEKFDIIVSNPPYIRSKVISSLDKEVQNEPILALDGGEDGLKFYKKIINNACEFLNKEGYLCLEIGYDQKEEVMFLIKEEAKYSENIDNIKDLSGNDRVIVVKIK